MWEVKIKLEWQRLARIILVLVSILFFIFGTPVFAASATDALPSEESNSAMGTNSPINDSAATVLAQRKSTQTGLSQSTNQTTTEEKVVPFTTRFETGLEDWTVNSRYRTGDKKEPGAGEFRQSLLSRGDGGYSTQYGGSVRLSVDGGPSTVGVARNTSGIPNGTQITATFQSDTFRGEPGGVKLLLYPPGEANQNQVQLDRVNNEGFTGRGVLSGTVSQEYPSGTQIRVTADVWPGEYDIYVTNISAGRNQTEKITLNSPSGEYVIGSEATVSGTTTNGITDIALYARDKGDFKYLLDIPVDADNDFREEDVVLTGSPSVSSDILTVPGMYEIAAVDSNDANIDSDDDGNPDVSVSSSKIDAAVSVQSTLHVTDPTLTVNHVSMINGQVAIEDADGGIKINGTARGHDSVTVEFYGPRGTYDRTVINVNDAGVFDSETIQVGGNLDNISPLRTEIDTELSQGNVVMRVYATGRDGIAGDGSVDVEDINGDGARDFLDLFIKVNEESNSQQQVIEQIASETTDDTGSDDLSRTFEFDLTDSNIEITDISPRSGSAENIPVDSDVTISGLTNRQPKDTTIMVEVIDGPSAESFDLVATDTWGPSGQWTATLDSGNVEPGVYTVEASVAGTTTTTTFQVGSGNTDPNQPPNATFSHSPSDININQKVEFIADASDLDGQITSYEWDFGDGSSATGTSPTHTYSSSGEYMVELTVTDNDGQTTTVQQTVTVAEVNQEPTVSIGYSPSQPAAGSKVVFTADASDPDGQITGYEWDFGDGSSATGTSPTHTYSSSGEYTVELTVTDNDGQATTVQETVSIGDINQSPEVSFQFSPSDPDENSEIQFTADASDPDGRITSYQWDFGDGSIGTSSSPTHTYTDPGQYTVELTVSDNDGRTATARKTLSVSDINQPPEVSFQHSPASPVEDSEIQFTADATDPDGQITSYQWDFGDGSTATGSEPTHIYADSGSYTVELIVTDDSGETATAERSVSIGSVNEQPTVDFEIDPTSPQEGSTVTFDAQAQDPDGRIIEYEWDFDDGAAGNGANAFHSFSEPGKYDVTLTVEDNQGSEQTTSKEITVEASPEPRIQSVTPSTEGAALEGIDFRNTYSVNINSQQSIEEVRFTLDGETQVDQNGADGWSKSLNLGVLDGDGQLKVTAVDSDGDTDTYTAHIDVEGIPAWLETVRESGQVEVNGDSVVISKRVPNPPIDASLTIPPAVPTIGGPQSFEARSEIRVVYDMPAEQAQVMANGELSVDVLGRSGEGEITANGRVNAGEWDLRQGEITVHAEVSAVSQSWQFKPETGVGLIDNRLPGVEASIEARPTARLNAQIDNRNSNLVVTRGTIAPGIEATGQLYQSFGLGSISASVSGDMTGALSVPAPYDPRATAEIRATGTATALGQSASVSVGPIRESVGGGVRLDSASHPSPENWSSWEFREGRSGIPKASSVPVNKSAQIQPMSTLNLPGRNMSPTAAVQSRDRTSRSVPVTLRQGRMIRSPGSLARLTMDGLEDRSPAVMTTDSGYGLVWARQDLTDADAAGNDIYWRNNDGSSWSQPQQISDNTKIELKPSVATDSTTNTHLAAWMIVNRTVSESEGAGPDDLAPATEIAFATGNDDTWTEPTIITDNNAIDSSVRVAQSNDQWLLTWIQDTQPGVDSAGHKLKYALVDQSGDVTNTGQIGQDRTRSPVLTATNTGFRIAYFRPTSQSERNGTVVVGSFISSFEQTATYETERFRDLAVSNQSIAWADGSASSPQLHYARNGQESVVNSERGVSDISEVGLFNGAGTDVLTYRGEAPHSSQKQIFYRIRQSDGWRSERPIAGGDRPNLTFWQATYAPAQNGFLSVFMGRNFDTEQNNDLFAVQHSYNPDLALSASTDAGNSQQAGDQFEIDYNVTNTGDIPVQNQFEVGLYAGSQQLKTTQYTGIGVSENITGSFTATVGEYDSYTVRVTPSGGLTELTKANNEVSLVPFKPDLQIRTADTSRIGDRLQYTLTVANSGAVSAKATQYMVRNGNATVDSGTVTSIAGGATQQVAGAVPVSLINQSAESMVIVDPKDTVTESNERNNTEAINPLAPDLSVNDNAITYYQRGETLIASVTIANQGAGGTNGVLRVMANGAEAGQTEYSINGTRQSNVTVFKTVNVSITGVTRNESITAVVESALPETNRLDNAATDSVTNIKTATVPDTLTAIAQSDGRSGISAQDIISAIVAFNTDSRMAGYEIEADDIISAIVQYNTGG